MADSTFAQSPSAPTPVDSSAPSAPSAPKNVFEDQKKVDLIMGMNPKKYAEIKKVCRVHL